MTLHEKRAGAASCGNDPASPRSKVMEEVVVRGSEQTDEDAMRRLNALTTTLGTLPRQRKPMGIIERWKTAYIAASEYETRVIVLEKDHEESFGFELQTCRQLKDASVHMEMYSYVSSIRENSSAAKAALKRGERIVKVNDEDVKHSNHKEIVEMVRSSGDSVCLEVHSGPAVKKMELQDRMVSLKNELEQKCMEFKMLFVEEAKLVDCAEDEAFVSETLRFLSNLESRLSRKSYNSSLSKSTTSLVSMCASIRSPMRACRSEINLKQMDEDRLSLRLSTLPRKGKKGTLRKSLRRFIPGISKTLEEEQTPF
uniref:cytohesin-interacting protein-like isoform X2 n=1 Tax=Myxine glutinosa TaxID=7769 RepID=UPI00358F029D